MRHTISVESLQTLNTNQQTILISKGDRRRKLDAKLINGVQEVLESATIKYGLTHITGEMSLASSKSATINLGEQLHALVDTILDKTNNQGWKDHNTFATLVNNTPNRISTTDKDYYVLVVKSTVKGLFKISKDTIKDLELLGLRLTLENVLNYGVRVKA